MKIFIIIEIILAFLCLVISMGNAKIIHETILAKGYRKITKPNCFTRVVVYLKIFIMGLIPIYNIIVLIGLLFCFDRARENFLKNIDSNPDYKKI